MSLTGAFALSFALGVAAPASADPADNDDFANAMEITSLPFEHEGMLDGSSVESGEPSSCEDDSAETSVWFTFTPDEDADILARVDPDFGEDASGAFEIYEGSDQSTLREVDCQYLWNPPRSLFFPARAGKTYRIRIAANLRGDEGSYRLEVAQDAAGKIAGRVTDEAGEPLGTACVSAWGPDENEWDEEAPPGGSTLTDTEGRYQVGGLPAGDYTVTFSDCGGGQNIYATEYYEDHLEEADADPVHVDEGTRVSGIDAELALGGSISGTVTDEGGLPLEGICVEGYASGSWGEATTDAQGRYLLTGFSAGEARVAFDDCAEDPRYLSEWFDDAKEQEDADQVPVAIRQETSGIDAALTLGASISGVVTSEAGEPLESICVGIHEPGSRWSDIQAYTDENGHYSAGPLQTGEFNVSFEDCNFPRLYSPEWYDDHESQAESDLVSVEAGADTGSIDAQLSPGARISGSVTDEHGDPLMFVCVRLSDGPFEWIDSDVTLNEGKYEFSGLPPGDDYRVGFEDCNNGDLVSEWYDNASEADAADRLVVAEGEHLSGIDAQLVQGGSLSGVVTDPDGIAADFLCVSAYGADGDEFDQINTDPSGHYSFEGIPPGEYRLLFWDCLHERFKTEWFDNKPTLSTADPVLVLAGEETSGIDAVLGPPGVTLRETDGSTSVSEAGAFDTYQLSLDAEPSSSVTVSLAHGAQLTASPSSVTFTPSDWTQSKTITVRAVNDSIAESDQTDEITHAVSSTDPMFDGAEVPPVSVVIFDNDTAGVIVTETGTSTAVTEGGSTDTYRLKLQSQPLQNATITITPDDQLAAQPASVTFTPANWSTNRTITVSAIDDSAIEGAHSGVVSHSGTSGDPSYEGLAAPQLPVAISDNDAPATTMTYSGPTTGYRNDTVSLSTRLTEADSGTGVAGKTVAFLLKQGDATRRTATAVTDADGKATASMSLTNSVGSYTMTTWFGGDSSYEGTTDDDPFTIQARPATLTYTGPASGVRDSSTQVSATLSDGITTSALSGGVVTFKLMSGPVVVRQVSATTASNGKAMANMVLAHPAGSYEIVVAFDGDNTYASSTDSAAFMIEPRPTAISYSGPNSAPWGSTQTMSAVLRDSGSHYELGQRAVEFRILDGQEVLWSSSALTYGNGSASVVVVLDLPPGEYRGEARFLGDAGHGGSSESASLSVVERYVYLAYEGPSQATRGSTITLRGRVIDPEGREVMPGQQVNFTLGETVQTGSTGQDGWAEVQMPVNLEPGTHTVWLEMPRTQFYSGNTTGGSLQVRWEHTFYGTGTGGVIQLNPTTREFRFELGTEISAIKSDPAMQIDTLPTGQRVVRIDYEDSELELQGVFKLETQTFAAVVTTASGTHVMGNPVPASN